MEFSHLLEFRLDFENFLSVSLEGFYAPYFIFSIAAFLIVFVSFCFLSLILITLFTTFQTRWFLHFGVLGQGLHFAAAWLQLALLLRCWWRILRAYKKRLPFSKRLWRESRIWDAIKHSIVYPLKTVCSSSCSPYAFVPSVGHFRSLSTSWVNLFSPVS